MKVTYVVLGLGFGDDENEWERCGTYKSKNNADATAAQIVKDLKMDGVPDAANYVKVEVIIVQ